MKLRWFCHYLRSCYGRAQSGKAAAAEGFTPLWDSVPEGKRPSSQSMLWLQFYCELSHADYLDQRPSHADDVSISALQRIEAVAGRHQRRIDDIIMISNFLPNTFVELLFFIFFYKDISRKAAFTIDNSIEYMSYVSCSHRLVEAFLVSSP